MAPTPDPPDPQALGPLTISFTSLNLSVQSVAFIPTGQYCNTRVVILKLVIQKRVLDLKVRAQRVGVRWGDHPGRKSARLTNTC